MAHRGVPLVARRTRAWPDFRRGRQAAMIGVDTSSGPPRLHGRQFQAAGRQAMKASTHRDKVRAAPTDVGAQPAPRAPEVPVLRLARAANLHRPRHVASVSDAHQARRIEQDGAFLSAARLRLRTMLSRAARRVRLADAICSRSTRTSRRTPTPGSSMLASTSRPFRRGSASTRTASSWRSRATTATFCSTS